MAGGPWREVLGGRVLGRRVLGRSSAGGSLAGSPWQEVLGRVVLGRRSLTGGSRQEVLGRRVLGKRVLNRSSAGGSSAGGPRQEVLSRRVLGERLLGALVARMGMGHVESHPLETIVVRVCGVGTVGVDASQVCVPWGLLMYERWFSIASKPSRPFRGWSLGVSCTSSGCLMTGCC